MVMRKYSNKNSVNNEYSNDSNSNYRNEKYGNNSSVNDTYSNSIIIAVLVVGVGE